MMSTRRHFLHSAGASLLTGTVISHNAAIAFAKDASTRSEQGINPASLLVKLIFPNGEILVFPGMDGKELGDFVVPFANIVQRNILVTLPGSLYSIYLRPDRNSKRVEAVILYGDPMHDSPATSGPYKFEIFANGKSLDTVDVPFHFWLARWRWATAVRPRVRTPQSLANAKLVPRYAQTKVTNPRLPSAAPDYAIMGRSSITPFMGETGERADIGLNPEYTAAYLATEDATAYQSMMAWAECSGSGPWHLNDKGKIINWDNHPLANTYSTETSNPPIYIMKLDRAYPDFLRPDDAHHPCLSYVPFLTTGDPYHAEELQYQINFYLGGEHFDGSLLDPQRRAAGGKTYVCDTGQTRGFAWMLRDLAFCYRMGGLIQSPVLLPKTFWKKALNANLKYVVDYFVNGAEPKDTVFGSGTSQHAMGWWQEDYLCTVLGVMVKTFGFSDWQPALEWKLKSNRGRLSKDYGNGLNPLIYFAQFVKQEAIGGTMEFTPLSERSRPYSYVGDWKLTFTDANTYTIIDPRGRNLGIGKRGKKTSVGSVPAHMVTSLGIPGQTIIWRMSKVSTWPALWDVNETFGIVKSSPNGKMVVMNNAYAGSLYAALATSMSPLLPDYELKLLDAVGAKISWRNSFAT